MPSIRDYFYQFHKFGDHDTVYAISDQDVTSDPQYYGYVSSGGAWYIEQVNNANGTFRYAIGTTDYTTNWTNHAALTYKRYDQLFATAG